jgi:hypothetical protein
MVPGQIYEPLVESRRTSVGGLQHCTLLVVHQHFACDAAKVFEAPNETLIRVFGILALAAPEMESPGVSQCSH